MGKQPFGQLLRNKGNRSWRFAICLQDLFPAEVALPAEYVLEMLFVAIVDRHVHHQPMNGLCTDDVARDLSIYRHAQSNPFHMLWSDPIIFAFVSPSSTRKFDEENKRSTTEVNKASAEQKRKEEDNDESMMKVAEKRFTSKDDRDMEVILEYLHVKGN